MSVPSAQAVVRTWKGNEVYDATGPRFRIPIEDGWNDGDVVFEIWPVTDAQRQILQGEVTKSPNGLYWYVTPSEFQANPALWTSDLTGWQLTIFNRPAPTQTWSPSNQQELDYKGLEAQLDKTTKLAQAALEMARRAFQIHPRSAPPFYGQEATLPEVTVDLKPGQFLAIDENGGLTTRQGVNETYGQILTTGTVTLNEETGDFTPSTIGASAYVQGAIGGPASYAGRFKIMKTSNWSDFTTVYESEVNEILCSFTIPEGETAAGYRVILFPAYDDMTDLTRALDVGSVSIVTLGQGNPGPYYETRYKRSNTQPAAPTLPSPTDWKIDIGLLPGGEDLWQTIAQKDYLGQLQGTGWSAPTRVPSVAHVPYYMGMFATPPTSPTPNVGDWYLSSAVATLGKIYKCTSTGPDTWAETTETDKLMAALKDVLGLASNSNATAFVQTLIANAIFANTVAVKTDLTVGNIAGDFNQKITNIAGDVIKTGKIKSSNLQGTGPGGVTQGMEIDLSGATISTKDFHVNAQGMVTMTKGFGQFGPIETKTGFYGQYNITPTTTIGTIITWMQSHGLTGEMIFPCEGIQTTPVSKPVVGIGWYTNHLGNKYFHISIPDGQSRSFLWSTGPGQLVGITATIFYISNFTLCGDLRPKISETFSIGKMRNISSQNMETDFFTTGSLISTEGLKKVATIGSTLYTTVYANLQDLNWKENTVHIAIVEHNPNNYHDIGAIRKKTLSGVTWYYMNVRDVNTWAISSTTPGTSNADIWVL